MIPPSWFKDAYARVTPLIQRTPLDYDPDLDIYIKWENQQLTGSFKVRGALNKVLCLQPWELQQGLVAASAGNHGQGVAYAARMNGAQATVFASEHAVPSKLAAMQSLGAEVILVPGGYAEAENAGIEFARQHASTWISPYNDGQVIAGQGTLGIETGEQLGLKPVRSIICPAGGGGLASGLGLTIRDWTSRPELIAVQSEASPFLFGLYAHGTQGGIQDLPSIADGLAGALEDDSITIPLIRQVVGRFLLVSEVEIEKTIAYAWHHYGQKIEGSGAVSLSAALFRPEIPRPAVVIITGGNIQPEAHDAIVRKYPQATREVLH